MPDVVFHAATVWCGILLASTLAVLIRARSSLLRILAVETALLLVVAFLLLLAIDSARAVYVDVAIALALLGFTTTVALVRLEQAGGAE